MAGGREVDLFNNSLTRSGLSTTANKVNGGKTLYNSTNWQNTNTLTYDKKFNKNHSLNVLGGMTMEAGKSSVFGATAILLPNETLGLNGLDEGNPSTITSFSTDWSQMSFLSRVNYSLKSKYLFTASVRADGSSRFTGDNKWGFFPSGAFAWRLGSEEFVKKYKFISNAKLRASWGITGNNLISNYAAYPGISVDNSSGYSFGNNLQKGSYASILGNSNLRWESTEQTDLGLDLGFFKERLTITADVYRKNTEDLLLNADQALSTGYERQLMNIGKVRNEGLEISVGFIPVDKKLRWSSEFNISFNRNKVVALADEQSYLLTSMRWGDDWGNIYPYIAQVGGPIAQVYGYLFDGVYRAEDFDIDGSGSQVLKYDRPANGEDRAGIKPGDIRYKDINGDLLINESDKTIIAQPYPIHTGGFNNNFEYKGFDLNVFFQWSYGNDIINANRQMLESGYKYNTNQFASYANRWSPENPDSDIPAAKGITMKAYSTRIIEDGSYLRLKTVAFGYTLPKRMLQRLRVGSLRVYASAQNLHTWTKYSGYDPEVSVRRSALTPGFDYSAYPRAKTLTFGLNATF
ncbi:SusC/RagA family TonB-linked outer membrane protein [Arcticibacter sp. MXS-1]|uniref:SusC/RagA family TonB-linked outer membrane protein n=1 Tax=Arcticibacter sp. MXS-1 TaxID=3341726 RepID=UPI0035A865C2